MSTYPSFQSDEGVQPVNVLLVSPNLELRRSLREKLSHPRWIVREAHSGSEALEKLMEESSGVMLLDTRLPDLDPTEFNILVNQQFQQVQVLTINSQTGQTVMGTTTPNRLSTELAELLRFGSMAARPAPATASIAFHRPAAGIQNGWQGMIGASAPMQRVYHAARLVARRDTSVLILGESGTGKDH
jgi:DNA-binding NtrC family response regulator